MNRGSKHLEISSSPVPAAEDETPLLLGPKREVAPVETLNAKGIKLAMCFVGLQGSYVTWGFIQEKVMTHSYASGMFPSTVFLVCANRTLALLVAGTLMVYKSQVLKQKAPKAPFYQYSPCSISNILSSWAQYECLKYVTFPTQTLFKSSKVIPVMLVGKFLHKKTYPWIEYLEAVGITLGVSVFMITEKASGKKTGSEDSTLGVLILCVYVFCDSFTSQWQDRIYKNFHVDQYAMMFGVNFWSLAFTACSLVATGEMFTTLAFLREEPLALQNVLMLSFTSATGQLFIFYTIKKFGPVVFTIMMTTRQMLSLVVSCLVFGHVLGMASVFGSLIVFGVLFFRITRKSRA